MKGFFIAIGVTLLVVGLMVGCGVFSAASWFTSRAMDVAKEQLDPAELLRKYEWFKNASAALDAKQADIRVYEKKITRVRKLEDENRLDRTNREQLMIWEQEMAGVKLSYNDLANDYNAQMSKINWRFTNIGGLPQGATQPLPREFKPYVEE